MMHVYDRGGKQH